MKILMLSHDKTLFHADSDSRRRMREYAALIEGLWILVPTSGVESGWEEEKLHVVPARSRSRILLFWRLRRIAARIARAEGIHLIVSQDPFEFGRVALGLKKKLSIAMQVQLHGDFYSGSSWKWSSVLNFFRYYSGKRILRQADGIRAVSERIRSSLVLRLGIPDERIAVFPVPVDTEKFLKSPVAMFLRERYGNFDFFFLTVGALQSVKNIRLQIRALAELVRERPRTALIIVGDGWGRAQLEVLAKGLGVRQNVVFVGSVEDLAPYYKSADVFILTSRSEGWGRAVVEAMASGLAVIMTDVGLAGEVLQHSKNGIVIPGNDEKALIAAMKRLMADGALRKRLGEAAREAARALPDRRALLQRYRESWEQCLK